MPRNSPMTSIGQRPSASVDEDLQNLYDEVWASFADESGAPTTAQDDQENIYAAGPEYQPQTASTTPVSPSSIRSCALCSSPACICADASFDSHALQCLHKFIAHSPVLRAQHRSDSPIATYGYYAPQPPNLPIVLLHTRA